jgi:AraC-like DNA-binding protein
MVVQLQPRPAPDGWARQGFASIEQHYATLKRVRPDLAWTSRQLARGAIEGSVIATRTPRFAVTCTAARGSFEMKGPVSTENPVLTLALVYQSLGLQWMQPVKAGMAGFVLPGVAVDAINRDSVSFVVIDISQDELEREVALEGLAVPAGRFARSAVLPGAVPAHRLARLARLVGRRHEGDAPDLPPGVSLENLLVAATVGQLAAPDHISPRLPHIAYCRIVERARAHIEAHLENPIPIDALVMAAITSRRTLHRAFIEVLGETPQSYVLKLRLNRIRQDLAAPDEAQRTVTMVSHRWGIAELGKLAARYREQFGELPSETLARRAANQGSHPARELAQTA